MKNRSYYSLFIFYVAVFAFILYLNGIFTGEVGSISNLLINLIILVIIGFLFLLSALRFGRLRKCCLALTRATDLIRNDYDLHKCNLWDLYSQREALFGHPLLDDAYARYVHCMKSYQTKHGLINSRDLEEYINEDLLDFVGGTHFISNIPGTLTGLGIFGTFLGLSLGLGSFSGNDIFTISDNIGPLMDGMKVAFHTSVYGIFFSLIFTFIYRGIMASAYQTLEKFLSCYKEYVMPNAACGSNEDAKVMLLYQTNIANSLKNILDVLKGTSAAQTEAVKQMVQDFSCRLSQTMSSDFAQVGVALNNVCNNQTAYAQNYTAMERTTRALLESNTIMQATLEQTLKQQELFAKELKQQQEKIDELCGVINEDIGNQLYTLGQMRTLYEK